jgi:hypothetical protein
MTARRTIAVLVCLTSISWAVAAQGPRRDGNWEITMEMDMPGMPMKMPPVKTVQCITPQQANDPNLALPKSNQGKNDSCKVTDQKIVGNKVSWAIACGGQAPMSGNGEITYAGDSYDGWMKMKTASGEMTMKYTGKRLGDCTK